MSYVLNEYCNQTLLFNEFEIIIVDDGSLDQTYECVNQIITRTRLRVKYFKQDHLGPAAARNLGIKKANSEIILFTGDDIVPEKDLLQQHIMIHNKYPKDNIAILGYITWSKSLKVSPFMSWINIGGGQFGYNLIIDPFNVKYKHFYTSNISFKRRFLIENGIFDEDFKYAGYEDIELGYRLSLKGLKIIFNDEAIAYHFHRINILQFLNRQKIVGMCANIFFAKHPELNSDISSPTFKERILLFIAPIIKWFVFIVDFFGIPIDRKIYDIVLRYYYKKGIKIKRKGVV